MSTPVISVEGLWKEYRLGTISHRTLAKDVQSWWARKRGKEDPNAQLASEFEAGSDAGNSADEVGSDRFWALKDVSFEVRQGEVLGIIGANGAGKSTLLKILSRVTTPTRGEIKVKGRIASLLEVGTGFHPELTGRENVFLNGAILGMTRAEVRSKIDEIIDFAGIEKFIDTPVKRYSSGMYVRLAFAVAAHLDPEILIVDEVLAVGDLRFQRKCLGQIKKLSGENRTVLFVSHNMESIRRLCHRALLLSNGGVYDDLPSELAVLKYLELNAVGRNAVNGKWKVEISEGLSLEEARIAGECGETNGVCKTGEALDVDLKFNVTERIEGASIELVIYSGEGVPLHRDASHFDLRKELVFDVGMQVAKCRFNNLPLAAGKYRMGIGVVKPAQKYYFKLEDGIEFDVGVNDVFENHRPPSQPQSLVAMLGKWNVTVG